MRYLYSSYLSTPNQRRVLCLTIYLLLIVPIYVTYANVENPLVSCYSRRFNYGSVTLVNGRISKETWTTYKRPETNGQPNMGGISYDKSVIQLASKSILSLLSNQFNPQTLVLQTTIGKRQAEMQTSNATDKPKDQPTLTRYRGNIWETTVTKFCFSNEDTIMKAKNDKQKPKATKPKGKPISEYGGSFPSLGLKRNAHSAFLKTLRESAISFKVTAEDATTYQKPNANGVMKSLSAFGSWGSAPTLYCIEVETKKRIIRLHGMGKLSVSRFDGTVAEGENKTADSLIASLDL